MLKKNEKSVIEYYEKHRDVLNYEEKRIELDLLKMIKYYEKTYGRYFTDSEKEWRQVDKLRNLELEGTREIRRLIKEQKEKDREQRSMKIIDPRLVNQNSLLSNNEELIE
jgi:hypothetical protein